jgi:hypothetical protein
VEIDFNFVRDRVADKSLQVLFIPSNDQLADVLTKPIVATRFHEFCNKLDVCSPPLNLQEYVTAYHVLSKITHIQTNSNPVRESSDKRLESNEQVIRDKNQTSDMFEFCHS